VHLFPLPYVVGVVVLAAPVGKNNLIGREIESVVSMFWIKALREIKKTGLANIKQVYRICERLPVKSL
jgi:hypothetical protein